MVLTAVVEVVAAIGTVRVGTWGSGEAGGRGERVGWSWTERTERNSDGRVRIGVWRANSAHMAPTMRLISRKCVEGGRGGGEGGASDQVPNT